jgi:hypothetical protein
MVRVEVKIGRITALCPGCGDGRFVAPSKRLRSMDILTCVRCGTKVTYILLREQATRKSIQEAQKAIEASKALRRPKE